VQQRLVPLADVQQHVCENQRMTAAQRAEQLRERAASYAWRLEE
jgi:hypothetical protein